MSPAVERIAPAPALVPGAGQHCTLLVDRTLPRTLDLRNREAKGLAVEVKIRARDIGRALVGTIQASTQSAVSASLQV